MLYMWLCSPDIWERLYYLTNDLSPHNILMTFDSYRSIIINSSNVHSIISNVGYVTYAADYNVLLMILLFIRVIFSLFSPLCLSFSPLVLSLLTFTFMLFTFSFIPFDLYVYAFHL